jgi:FixJ family two-component response regulator
MQALRSLGNVRMVVVDRPPEDVLRERSLISIVDDDQPVRDSMRRLMRSLGYAVEVFPSAADFLASPRLGDTGCLIADVHMPGMNGDELHRSLLKTGHAIPTILVTAFPDEAIRERALKDGILCYIHKPLDKKQLVDCIRLAFAGSGSGENS